MGGVTVGQLISTMPVYPLTEVRIIGMNPKPLEGRVIFLAEIVKLGVVASACAPPRF
jgi:hypothetical protein